MILCQHLSVDSWSWFQLSSDVWPRLTLFSSQLHSTVVMCWIINNNKAVFWWSFKLFCNSHVLITSCHMRGFFYRLFTLQSPEDSDNTGLLLDWHHHVITVTDITKPYTTTNTSLEQRFLIWEIIHWIEKQEVFLSLYFCLSATWKPEPKKRNTKLKQNVSELVWE